jgi:hypothetical protein
MLISHEQRHRVEEEQRARGERKPTDRREEVT